MVLHEKKENDHFWLEDKFLGSAIRNAQRIVRRTRILILRCKGTTRLGRIGDLWTTVEGEGTENLFFPTLVSSVSRDRTLRLA